METLSAKITRNPVILEQLFGHLPPSDIKTVALVNRTWNYVVEQPRYWTWVEASLYETNFDEFNGYTNVNLFKGMQYDQEDAEADEIYETVDKKMDERRREYREAKEQEMLQKYQDW